MWPEKQWALDNKEESLEAGGHFRDTEETVLLQQEGKQRDKCNTKSFSVTWFLSVYDNDIWNIY